MIERLRLERMQAAEGLVYEGDGLAGRAKEQLIVVAVQLAVVVGELVRRKVWVVGRLNLLVLPCVSRSDDGNSLLIAIIP